MNSFRFLFSAMLLFGSAAAQADEHFVRGIVYEDINKNGMYDVDEPGIPNVLVSNQEQVARTNATGEYTLPVRDEMILFITKPAAYEVPRDDCSLPQFYYIHQPGGSPYGLDYQGIAPTGDLPESVDFALYKSDAQERFNVIVTGDPQPRDSTEVGYYRDDIVAGMYGTDAEFYLALGDIAFDNLNIYRQYNEIVGRLGMPAYTVHGNHDMNYKVPDDRYAAETFKRIYGPPDYSFDYGRVHFIVLDDIAYNGWDQTGHKRGGYRGFINERQLSWLRNDLAQVPDDHLVVISTHIPIVSTHSDAEGVNVVNREALFDVLKDRRHLLALSAHMHYIEHLQFDASMGWDSDAPFYSINAGAGCGAWWSGPKDARGIPESYCLDGTPNGYFIFEFTDNTFNYRYIPANMHPAMQMRISYPCGMVAPDSLGGKDIVVNVFNADPGAFVQYQLDDRAPVTMTQQRMSDPFMVGYIARREHFPAWIDEAVGNTHIWTSPMPVDLTPGTHSIRVGAVDSKGNAFQGFVIFNIE